MHCLSIAGALVRLGASVTVFSPFSGKTDILKERLGLDLQGLRFRKLDSPSPNELARISSEFDLFIHSSIIDSLPELRSRIRIALVFFPFRFSANKPRTLGNYTAIWTNSRFTARWVREYWGLRASVLYPPVTPPPRASRSKGSSIISVGRFFRGEHDKNHLVIIDAFERFAANRDGQWRLLLAGGLRDRDADVAYFREVEDAAKNKKVELFPNISRSGLEALYSRSLFYWHAAGYGVDQNTHPERCEHFGITTLEGMGSGCIPFVVPFGGQPEIVKHLRSGLHWHTLDELVTLAWRVADDSQLRSELASGARLRSLRFGWNRFTRHLVKLIQCTETAAH